MVKKNNTQGFICKLANSVLLGRKIIKISAINQGRIVFKCNNGNKVSTQQTNWVSNSFASVKKTVPFNNFCINQKQISFMRNPNYMRNGRKSAYAKEYQSNLTELEEAFNAEDYEKSENIANSLIDMANSVNTKNKNILNIDSKVHYYLIDSLMAQGKNVNAQRVANSYINAIAKSAMEDSSLPLPLAVKHIKKNRPIHMANQFQEIKYSKHIKEWESLPPAKRFFKSKPTPPTDKPFKEYIGEESKLKKATELSEAYKKLSEICTKLLDPYAAAVCEQASYSLSNADEIGEKILLRRANGNEYIGDLYPEIKQKKYKFIF